MPRPSQPPRPDPAEPSRSPYGPPEAPTLTDSEIDSAMTSGGMLGILAALRHKAAADGPLGSEADAIGAVGLALDQYRAGSGGPDHLAILGHIEPYARSVAVLARALSYAAGWVAGNPGKIVTDAGHSSGRRRVFGEPEARPDRPVMGPPLAAASGESPSSAPAAYIEK